MFPAAWGFIINSKFSGLEVLFRIIEWYYDIKIYNIFYSINTNDIQHTYIVNIQSETFTVKRQMCNKIQTH